MSCCAYCYDDLPEDFVEWEGEFFCDKYCAHEGGDRRGCELGWCSCTKLALRMRTLRKHRRQMRVMRQLIVDEGLFPELQAQMQGETGDDPIELDEDSELDERNDPEVLLREARAALDDQSNMLEVAQLMVEAQRLRSEDDDMRKQMEDMRKQLEDMSVGTALDSMD